MSCFVQLPNGTLFELYPILDTTLVHDVLYTIQHVRGQITECYLEDKDGEPLHPLATVESIDDHHTFYYKCIYPRKHITVPLPYQHLSVRKIDHQGMSTDIRLFYSKHYLQSSVV